MYVLPEDTSVMVGQRKKLIEGLKTKKELNPKVLEAMMQVPRHWFFESAFFNWAYKDKPFQIGAGQTISQPYTVAFQTTLLEVNPGEKILEIGTGSGYQACILAQLGAKVYTIERQKILYDKFKKMMPYLPSFRARIKPFYGDGFKGLPAYAPFDKILVTCGAPYVPQPLLAQLKPGGCVVIPVGEGEVQIMKKIIKYPDNTLEEINCGSFRFVPMIADKNHNN